MQLIQSIGCDHRLAQQEGRRGRLFVHGYFLLNFALVLPSLFSREGGVCFRKQSNTPRPPWKNDHSSQPAGLTA
jgi:hypothetical protein